MAFENITSMTEPQLIAECSKFASNKLLISFWGIMLILFALIGFSLVKEDRKKFFLIWSITALLSAGVLLFYILNPSTIISIINWFKSIN